MNASGNWLPELKKGNEQAYKALFYAYFPGLVAYANSILRDRALAEDVVQEFFVAFWYEKKYLYVRSGLEGYLYRSVRNLCLNAVRDGKRRSERLQQWPAEQEAGTAAPPDEAEAEREREEIFRALHGLPEQCRQAFTLCCLGGLTYQETAARMGVSVNTVRSHMARAFRLLRDALSGKTFSSILFSLITKR